MSHFLAPWLKKGNHKELTIHCRRACMSVMVHRAKKDVRLVIEAGSIGLVKDGVYLVELPPDVPVFGEDARIHPSPGMSFWVSLETFDPMHIVCELGKIPWGSSDFGYLTYHHPR